MASNRRVVIVTGGSRGLGLALVQKFLASGHCVATCSRVISAELAQLEQDVQLRNCFHFSPTDVGDETAVRDFVAAVHKRFGNIDALVNNAAVAYDGVLATMPGELVGQMLQVNLGGALLFAKECSRMMLLSDGGAIVNVSSIVGENGFSGVAAYSATKAGLIGLTRALARELGPRGIRVNAVAPGYLETELSKNLSPHQRDQIIRRTPLARLGSLDDIVPAIEFLLSPEAAFITGAVLTIDGGATA